MAELIPILYSVQKYSANRTLIDGVDFIVEGDCTGNDVDLTLPDAATATRPIFIKNTGLSATDVVKYIPAGSDDIEGVPASRPGILAASTEYVGLYPNGTTSWQRNNQRTFTFGSIECNSGSPTIGTSFANFDAWNVDAHSTPQKCEVNLTTKVIDILDFQGPFIDGYKVTATLSFEYTNNKIVIAQLYVNGALTGIPVSVNALGSGKPTTLNIADSIRVTSATTLELHIMAETGGAATLTIVEAKMICERIGG